MGIGEPGEIPRRVDDGALHPQADSQEGELPGAGEADRLHLPLDAPLAEATRHDEPVEPGQEPLGPLPLDVLAVDRLHAHLRVAGDATMIEGLVDALVGVAVLGILPHQRDRHLVLRVAEPMEDVVPGIEIGWRGLDPEAPQDDVVDAVGLERQRHLVDREILVALLDHRLERDIAKQRDLLPVGDVEGPLGAADEDVGLDADLPEDADGVLRRLRLQFTGRLQIGDEREVDEDAVLPPGRQRDLPDRLEEREALDVAHRAADLGDHDVGVGGAQIEHLLLDLVGDVGDHLDGLAEKLPAPFLVDHREIDLPGGVVALARQRRRGEALVVAEVEVGLTTVVEDVHLTVLIGAHRPRIDVDVRIELLHPHPEPAGLEEHADRRARQPLAERTDDPAGHEDVPGHACELLPFRPECRPLARRSSASCRPD